MDSVSVTLLSGKSRGPPHSIINTSGPSLSYCIRKLQYRVKGQNLWWPFTCCPFACYSLEKAKWIHLKKKILFAKKERESIMTQGDEREEERERERNIISVIISIGVFFSCKSKSLLVPPFLQLFSFTFLGLLYAIFCLYLIGIHKDAPENDGREREKIDN